MKAPIIIGSGPAAVGVALALIAHGLRPRVIDIGLELEPERRDKVTRLATTSRDDWSGDDVRAIGVQPSPSRVAGLPEKRNFGSDFPFRDAGQISNIDRGRSGHRTVVSGAYGGFSNVWGAQVMPFTEATFATWPIRGGEMAPHYTAILRHIPFSGETDDLSSLFPLYREPSGLPEISTRSKQVLSNYGQHRESLNTKGIRMGRARLALAATGCVKCGLCMTGCPYGLIYSASHSFDTFRRDGAIDYLPGLLAIHLEEDGGSARVIARSTRSGSTHVFEGDAVFVACGAFGSTQLVLGSLAERTVDVTAQESAQFTLPMLSRRAVMDPRTEATFTLNQFNMILDPAEDGLNLSQVHFYTYNPAFVDALPRALRRPVLAGPLRELLSRLTVAIGYLPSWQSPALRLQVTQRRLHDDLPHLAIEREDVPWRSNAMLRKVLWRLTQAAPQLDLWPVVPSLMIAPGAKTYHFGSTFPHAQGPPTSRTSDRLGRISGWRRIHLVDAAVFPNVPATTFTLTIMANAHRIATETIAATAVASEGETTSPISKCASW